METTQQSALAVLGWRQAVHKLYAQVRAEPDPATAHARWIADRTTMFHEHPASARMDDQELDHAPYRPEFRFELPLRAAEPDSWMYATATDGDVPFSRIGRFDLPGLGSLDAWWLESYGGGLFVPMRDASCGQTAYGAGRYVLDTVKGADLGRTADGRWILDLNFSYNPSCAYNPAWACPLAPAGNRIDGSVPAGELTPR